MKTSELTGAPLDYAVAVAADYLRAGSAGYGVLIPEVSSVALPMKAWSPSKRWAQGGPIIEREKICLEWGRTGEDWMAYIRHDGSAWRGLCFAPTPLIAAMRCFVASRLGDDVEIPNELQGESK